MFQLHFNRWKFNVRIAGDIVSASKILFHFNSNNHKNTKELTSVLFFD
jgi:hypothetical protein